MSKKKPRQTTTSSRSKRLVFGALTVLVPVLFFVAVEGVLRLAGYGDAYPLFVPFDDAPAYQVQNQTVAGRYFATEQSIPNSNLDFFRAEKQPDAFRIFVQGGSSAAGYPFYHGGAFSRMLEQRLQQTFPDRPIEVVNTAMAAVNSYTLLDFADEILAEQPDAVLIYAGHNEFYGALGVGSAESVAPFPWLVRTYVALRRYRLVQGLQALLGRIVAIGSSEEARRESTLMERMVREQEIPAGSRLFELGERQFRSNLDALLGLYAERGIPVYIGTLTSNELDHAPFTTRLQPDTDADAWRLRVDTGRKAIVAGDTTAAIEALQAAVSLDLQGAEAQYLLGRLLYAVGRFDEARAALRQAREHDQLRFRAPTSFNDAIRALAEQHGAEVVDVEQAFRETTPHGIVDGALMIEHLHPTVDGYFVMADAFYRALLRKEAIGPSTRLVPAAIAKTELLCTPVDSLMGMYRVQRLMASWPFVPVGQETIWQDTLRARTPVEAIAIDLYRNDITWQRAMARLGSYYAELGDSRRALQASLAMVQEYPFYPRAYLLAGNVLLGQQRVPEALVYFQAADDLEVTAETQRIIGAILLQQNRRAEAITHLETAIRLDPDDRQSLYNLAGAYALSARPDDARDVLNRLLALEPNHPDAHRLMQSLR